MLKSDLFYSMNKLSALKFYAQDMTSPVSPAWKKKGSITPLSTGSDKASLKYHSGLPLSSRPTCTCKDKVNI